jgi:putative transcriptional regulator
MSEERTMKVRRTADDTNDTVEEELPDGSTRSLTSGTDWDYLASMTEQEIEANALDDPDNPPLTDDELARMRPVPNPRAIRQRLHMTQEQFATRFQLRLGTVRDWEQGKKEPDSAAKALLRVIEHNPEAVLHALER